MQTVEQVKTCVVKRKIAEIQSVDLEPWEEDAQRGVQMVTLARVANHDSRNQTLTSVTSSSPADYETQVAVRAWMTTLVEPPTGRARRPQLTPREADIWMRTFEGETNDQIGASYNVNSSRVSAIRADSRGRLRDRRNHTEEIIPFLRGRDSYGL